MALLYISVSVGLLERHFIGELSPGAERGIRERLNALRARGAISEFSIEDFHRNANIADLAKLLDRLEADPPRQRSSAPR